MKIIIFLIINALTTVFALCQIAEKDRKQAIENYNNLNDSPIQQKLRKDKTWFCGPVLWLPGQVSEQKLDFEMKRIKDLGFNMVRFYPVDPGDSREYRDIDFELIDKWFNTARKNNLKIIFHPKMERPSDEVLKTRYRLTPEQFITLDSEDAQYQEIMKNFFSEIINRYKNHPALLAWGGFGEPHVANHDLSGKDTLLFAQWLEKKYTTPQAMDKAWNYYPAKGPFVKSFTEAWKLTDARSKHPFIHGFKTESPLTQKNYGAMGDMVAFQTDKELNKLKANIKLIKGFDPVNPITVGSHNLFINQPMLGWNIGKYARTGDLHFSSIHLPWHFGLVQGEVDVPVYLQSRMTKDYFKNAWTSTFETTGGAVQYSGGYGNSMDAGQMRRLMFNYLASGNFNIAFWTWNHRDGGWEAGEYGLTSLSGEITPWAQEAGKISKAIEKYHSELWEAENKPMAGILQSWNTQLVLLMEPERHDLQKGPEAISKGTATQAMRSYIGVGRSLVNSQIDFQYITEEELEEGIALYYPVIYVPHARALSDKTIEILKEYVEKGGHLIADVQFGFIDPYGKLRKSGQGKQLEQLFGAYPDMIHDARTGDLKLNEISVTGFYGEMKVTTATITAKFNNGMPAITTHKLGKGKASFIAFDTGNETFKPGKTSCEELISMMVRGNNLPEWTSTLAQTFRLSTPQADHYFFINDGDEKNVFLNVFNQKYKQGEYVIENAKIPVDGIISVQVPKNSAIWLRFEK